ncbi:MAG: ribose 5-phosphate isomerase B [Candidatus Kaelpia aquatica]|nr:ribose 5-phosphate isomerase B [Candidatus Kaelpia aquatica]
MKISLGSDHRGYKSKEYLKKILKDLDIAYSDEGTLGEESCDYPDFAKLAVERVLREEVDFAILICGSGLGMSIAANKFKGIRAALCLSADMAQMARQHNDANVLVLSASFIELGEIKNILNAWLGNDFEGGRHERRVRKISEFE